MTRIRNHHLGHIDRGVAHHDRLVTSKRLLATDCEDRHGELRTHGHHVVLRILPDGAKLSESRMHCAWQGVELGIVLPCHLVDLRRITGELIPKAVEIDALSSRHQTLHVRPAEIELPEQRATHGGIPGTGASITTSFSVRRSVSAALLVTN